MKTIIQMAREAGIRDCTCNGTKGCLERFASLVRADEREQRTWVGLTDEEYDEIWRQDLNNKGLMDLTIAKLKEKNT